MNHDKPIYVDYNATTPVDPAVVKEMKPYLTEHFGNASSNHWYGHKAKGALNQARRRVSEAIGCEVHEVVFTSGGTESNNFALRAITATNIHHGRHIITCAVEHPSVLEPCKFLELQGFDVTYLPVDSYGMVSMEEVRAAIRDDTILISIMHANNEVGTIQPIAEIGMLAKELGIYFHSDAAQSLGKIPVNVDDLAVDLLTIAGHKLYAPKGIGALYIREGTEIHSFLKGASQENGLRAGTEPVALIVALGKACQIAAETLHETASHLQQLRDRMYQLFLTATPDIKLNGHPTSNIPNTLNISFPGVLGPNLLAETPEIAASPGSACHAELCSVSPVLRAMEIEESYALGAVRFSVGKWSTEEEIDEVVDLISARYERMRAGHVHHPPALGY